MIALKNVMGGSYDTYNCWTSHGGGRSVYSYSYELASAWAGFWEAAGYEVGCSYTRWT